MKLSTFLVSFILGAVITVALFFSIEYIHKRTSSDDVIDTNLYIMSVDDARALYEEGWLEGHEQALKNCEERIKHTVLKVDSLIIENKTEKVW